eukprot:15431577-Alexandrium_andersonii.AAC.1
MGADDVDIRHRSEVKVWRLGEITQVLAGNVGAFRGHEDLAQGLDPDAQEARKRGRPGTGGARHR